MRLGDRKSNSVKAVKATMAMMLLLGLAAPGLWAHGSGHDDMSRGDSHHEEDNSQARAEKIEKKKQKIEAQLQDPKLSATKRAKLEKKLKKLQEMSR